MSEVNAPVRSPARSGTAARTVGLVAVAIVAIGLLGIQVGLLKPLVGFYLYALGALLGGASALLLGAFGLVVTRDGQDPSGRQRSLIGGCLGAALVGATLSAAASGGNAPAINDITTNLQDPPSFAKAGELEANRGRDMGYPEDFVAQVQKGYPDLAPLRLDVSQQESFRRALAAAEKLDWELTFQDAQAGVFEARSVSRVFKFVDDIAVRVRPDGQASVIDVRSKSRDGRGDLGANADRIRNFAHAFHDLPTVAADR